MTVAIKNRSNHPIIFKRAKSGVAALIEPYSAIGLKVYNDQPFIAIDWDSHTVTYDFGAED